MANFASAYLLEVVVALPDMERGKISSVAEVVRSSKLLENFISKYLHSEEHETLLTRVLNISFPREFSR